MLRATAAAREDGLDVSVTGMDEFDIADFGTELEDARQLLALGVASPTLKKEVFKKLALKYLCDARQDVKDRIAEEIEAGAELEGAGNDAGNVQPREMEMSDSSSAGRAGGGTPAEGRAGEAAWRKPKRGSAIRAELQKLGVAKLELAYKAVKDEVPREVGEMKEFLEKFVGENPELLPARLAGGSGASAGHAGAERRRAQWTSTRSGRG